MENTKTDTEENVLCAVKMPVSMMRDLDEIAKREGFLRGRSVIARKAVMEYIERNRREQMKEAA